MGGTAHPLVLFAQSHPHILFFCIIFVLIAKKNCTVITSKLPWRVCAERLFCFKKWINVSVWGWKYRVKRWSARGHISTHYTPCIASSAALGTPSLMIWFWKVWELQQERNGRENCTPDPALSFNWKMYEISSEKIEIQILKQKHHHSHFLKFGDAECSNETLIEENTTLVLTSKLGLAGIWKEVPRPKRKRKQWQSSITWEASIMYIHLL